MAEERALLEERHVRITTTRAQIEGTTYPIAGITSVRAGTRRESPLVGFAVGLLGMGLLFPAVVCWSRLSDAAVTGSELRLYFGGALLFGSLGAATCFGAWRILTQAAITYIVLLGTAGGDRKALATKDAAFAGRVREAIEQAIIARG